MPRVTGAKAALVVPRDLVVKRPPWLDDILFPWRICAQRILVVADGLDFNETNGFGLTQFLLTLETAAPFGLAPIIHIAHRDNNPAAASAAMQAKFTFHPGFTFVDGSAAHALMNGGVRRFDQLWLFGITDDAIGDDEVRVIASFMAARGGVFATGDHETLGRGMSGRLPRVRKMREWAAVPVGGQGRIDTVNEPSPGGPWTFDSQSDTLAQRIFPHFDEPSPGTYVAHPLLRYGASGNFQTGVVDVLPDHPHESECLAGWDLADPYTLVAGVDPVEFPPLPGAAAPFAPQIVATSISGGRILEKGPVHPRCFGAISAYDGHRVGKGRIVCDATWHHFVNINLDGTGNSSGHHGLQDALPTLPPTYTPNAAYLKIKQYFRNIAEWVGPVRRCRWYIDLVVERFRYPLLEEVSVLPPKPGWPELVELGAKVEGALDARCGRGTGAGLVQELLADRPHALALAGVRDALGDSGEKIAGSLVPPLELTRGLLGALAMGVFAGLPRSPWELRKVFEKNRDLDALADQTLDKALQAGLGIAREHYAQAAQRTLAAVEVLG